MKLYRAEYSDENFELINASTDYEAWKIASEFETRDILLFNIFLLDENFDAVKTIL